MMILKFSNIFSMLRSLDPSVGVLMFGAGIVLIFLGHRVYKPAVVLTYALAGYLITSQILHNETFVLPASIGAALVGGAVAGFLSKHAFAAMSGIAGAFLFMSLLDGAGHPGPLIWIIGAAIFIGLSAMSYVYWLHLLALVTSLEGAFLIVGSIGAIGAVSPALFRNFQQMTHQTAFFVPFVITVPTLIGFFLQSAVIQKKASGGPTI